MVHRDNIYDIYDMDDMDDMDDKKNETIKTSGHLDLGADLADNQLAAALGNGTVEQPFSDKNRIFNTVFPGIATPAQLYEYISNKTGNKTVITFNDGFWELLEMKINETETLYLLKNISFEMLALKQLKNKLNELSSSYDIYSRILEQELPLGLMIIDGDYNVSFVNQAMRRFFRIPSMLNLKKCYNYVKEIKPCRDCLLESVRAGKKQTRKTFTTENGKRMVTAEIHPLEDKYILIFRDTTKEINLIKEIKQQQEELENANRMIAEQNEILKGLSNINVRVSGMRDLETILETVIKSIIATFDSDKGAILLFNEAGKIKNAHFTGAIDGAEREMIIEYIATHPSVHQEAPAAPQPEKKKPDGYTTQDMIHKDVMMGQVFLYKPGKQIDETTLELFLMQVGSYLETLELQRRLEEVAQTDGLTGVFNRYYFDKRFQEEKEISRRFGQPLALILADVNGLKELNDNHGHEAGDLLLEQTARLLSGHVSSFDSVYRIGGDEFVVMVANCPQYQLDVLIEMFKELQTVASFQYNEQEFPIRFSLGGASSGDVGLDRLREEADRRMYRDKEEYYKKHKKYR